jgi:signal transduction histidine kinase
MTPNHLWEKRRYWQPISRSFIVTLFETLALSLLLRGAAVLLTRAGSPSPWPELLALLSEHTLWFWGVLRMVRFEHLNAWRLLRPVVFGALVGLGFALANLLLSAIMPPTRAFFAFQALIAPDPTRVSIEFVVLTTCLRFTFLYAIRAVWLEGRRSLRWRLTALALFGGVFAATVVSVLPSLTTLWRDPSARLTTEALRDASDLARAFQGAVGVSQNEAQLKRLFNYLEGRSQERRSRFEVLTDDGEPRSIILDPSRVAVLFDPNGLVLASSRPSRVATDTRIEPSGTVAQIKNVELEAWRDVLTIAQTGRCRALVIGTEVIAGCPARGVDSPGVVLGVIRSAQSSVGPVEIAAQISNDFTNALDSLSQAFLPIFLGLGFLGYVVSQRFTKPLEQLLDGVRAVEQGALTTRIPTEGEDEVTRLTQGFNAMTSRLETNVHELTQEKSKFEGLLEAKRGLTANASHELRTPLAVLRARLESAEMRGEALQTQDQEALLREVHRLETLVEDLIALSRADAEQLAFSLEPTALPEMVVQLFESLQPLAKASSLTLLNAVPARLLPVMADRARLEQVLRNLVVNAIRYTPEGGVVRISARARGDLISINIEDTGMGIAPDELERIFEPFYRTDPARARTTGGSGLGLAVVRELMARMNGRVQAESTQGRGSTFVLELPIARAS